MGWMDNIKDMLNNNHQDDDIEEENEDFEDDEEVVAVSQEEPEEVAESDEIPNLSAAFEAHHFGNRTAPKNQPIAPKPINDYRKTQGGTNMMENFGERSQILLFKPDSLDCIRSIADRVNQKKTVILNLEGRDEAFIKTVIDFFSGVAYANHGKISPIADQTYIVTPDNIDMDCEGGANIGDSELGNLDILDALNHDSF